MLRISTNMFFDQSAATMHRQQAEFMHVSEQLASGRRVVTPSDDSQAAAQAVGVSQSKAAAAQYIDARVSARNALSQEESVLASVADSIGSAKTLMVQAANGTLTDADRESIASELRGIREAVLSQANATDGNGTYLFGGYQDDSAPFVRNPAGDIVYQGDGNVREERVESSRYMKIANNGQEIFQSTNSSAGYLAEADSANTGSLTFTGPRILDPSHANYGTEFEIEFGQNAAGDTVYTINGGGPTVYEPGRAIEFGGLSITLDGTASVGDSIEVAPAQSMNSDLFATFDKALTELESPTETESDEAQLQNTINTVMSELDNSLDTVLTVRASVGARLNELDAMDSVGEQRVLNYEKTLSELIDLDYVEGISEYTRRQMGLQAAQKTFGDMSDHSLFKYI